MNKQDIENSSILQHQLYAVRGSISKHYGLNNLSFYSDDAYSSWLSEKIKVGDSIYFPYSYMYINSISLIREEIPNKNVARFGYRTGTSNASLSSSEVGFIFPINVNITLKYIHSDAFALIDFANLVLVLEAAGGLSFNTNYGSGLDVVSTIKMDGTLSFEPHIRNVQGVEDAGRVEVSLTCRLHTGFREGVASVNNDRPIVTTEV